MDYIAFKSLHRLLQKSIQEYIINEREINDANNGLKFYMRNGWITTEIRLACVLRYFTGGSYLDIMLSHGIGKTDLYRSIWAVIHATNACTTLQFSFPTTSAKCESYMAVPFQATVNGPKDSYNFYHSQVRINIECSFGILTN